jgi:hypothetical protein
MAWRMKRICAVVAVLAVVVAAPAASFAQSGGTPLIKIPPAQVPPSATPSQSSSSASPVISPVPRALLPTRVQVLHDSPGAGIAVYGALTGKATSAIGVIVAVFANSEAFDPTPVIKLMMADDNDRQGQALFTATVQGVPVIGVAVVALNDTGGDVTLFYDAATAFVASFPRMRGALAQSDGIGTAELFLLRLADGATISVPRGWRLTAQGQGLVSLRGPQGEFVSLGATMPVYAGDTAPGGAPLRAPCCDPVAAFTALYPRSVDSFPPAGGPPPELDAVVETQPFGSSGTSALILGDMRYGGADYAGLALAEATASLADPWTFGLSAILAPRAVFAVELPTLLQIWRSYGGAGPGFGAVLRQALGGMNAVQAMLKSSMTRRETTAYNADPDWQPLIAAQAVGSLDPSPGRPLTAAVSAHNGHSWRIVPETEWR